MPVLALSKFMLWLEKESQGSMEFCGAVQRSQRVGFLDEAGVSTYAPDLRSGAVWMFLTIYCDSYANMSEG